MLVSRTKQSLKSFKFLHKNDVCVILITHNSEDHERESIGQLLLNYNRLKIASDAGKEMVQGICRTFGNLLHVHCKIAAGLKMRILCLS